MPATIVHKYLAAHSGDGVRLLFYFSLMVAALSVPIHLVDAFADPAIPVAAPMPASPPVAALASAPSPAEQEPEAAAEILTPRMRAALEHVTSRYRVSAVALEPIFEAAELLGREKGLDPLLIVAVIGIESRFNPYAESHLGAQGLMQVIPRFHQDKLPPGAGKSPLFNPVTNVQVGTQVLHEAIRRHGGLMAGLQRYGGAVNDAEQVYAGKVLAEKQRLEQAARRTGETDA